jgi:RNA polymerase sigma-70 factor, ECF subfamily
MNAPPDNLAAMTDEQLATGAQSNDVRCFEEIVRRYQTFLLRFIRRQFPNVPDAEDVVQETFMRAYESIDRYQSRWPLRTWIFTLAYRNGITHARRAKTRLTEVLPDYQAAEGSSPAELASAQEPRRSLWDVARNVLNDDQYKALWLFYAEDMSVADISQVLGMSLVAVRTMLHRGRKKLMPYARRLIEAGGELCDFQTSPYIGDTP